MSGKLKTLSSIAAIACFVFLTAVSALADENTVWTKFDNSAPGFADSAVLNSRIPLGTSGKGDDWHAKPGCVIKDGSTYKMWYSGYDNPNWRIYYATSPDGLNWAKYDNNIPGASDSICTNGTIPLGTGGQGDSTGASRPSVIKDGSTYKMWYMGNIGGTNRIYYATSTDGLTWTKKNNDIPDDSDTNSTDGRIPLGQSGGDVNHSGYPTVILEGSTYKMWYGGRGPSSWRVYHASSTDGLNWTKYSNSVPPDSNTTGTNGCIPLGATGGDTTVVYYPCVILDGSTYRMWYSGKDASYYRIYNATSTDGLTWTKVTNAAPPDTSDTTNWGKGRIPRGTDGRGDDGVMHSPTVIKDEDTYKMWYAGSDEAKYRTYLATSTDSLTWTKKDNTIPDASDLPGNGRIPLGTGAKGDYNYTVYPTVIEDGDTYKMWYCGKDATTYRIYYATSPDGMIWVKYDNNTPGPSDSICTNGTIPLGTSGGDTAHVVESAVIKDGSTYKMWYAGTDGTNYRIYHASSSNGLTWIKYTNAVPDASNTTGTYGRIPIGTSGGDTKHVKGPSVIKDGSTYKMWYTGSDGTNYCIYHATSSNSLTWIKYDNSVPDDSNTTSTNGRIPMGTAGTGDEKFARMPAVIKAGSSYKMWYSGRNTNAPKDRIYYAFSTDGLTWTKCTNAIPANSDTTSTSGRVPLGESGGDINVAYTPCVIKEGLIQEGYKYKMWYTGKDASKYRIYLATCDQPPKEGTIFYSY